MHAELVEVAWEIATRDRVIRRRLNLTKKPRPISPPSGRKGLGVGNCDAEPSHPMTSATNERLQPRAESSDDERD